MGRVLTEIKGRLQLRAEYSANWQLPYEVFILSVMDKSFIWITDYRFVMFLDSTISE